MKAITNNASQEEVPGGGQCSLLSGRFASCLFACKYFTSLLHLFFLFFCILFLGVFVVVVLLRKHILNSQQDFSLWYSRVTATDKINIESSVSKLSAISGILFSFSP